MNQEELDEFRTRTHTVLDAAAVALTQIESELDQIPDRRVATMRQNVIDKIAEYRTVYGRDEHNNYSHLYNDDIIKKAAAIALLLEEIKRRVDRRLGIPPGAEGKKPRKTKRKTKRKPRKHKRSYRRI